MNKFDIIIVGAGGAGLMCAIHAGLRGRKVLLLDHNHKVGRKILISGGGRCNFTNINAGPDRYVSENPHFCKSALARYTPDDFIAMVKKHRIAFHEKKLGQLFCDGSAQQIVNMLLQECDRAKATIRLNCRITAVERDTTTFSVQTTQGNFTSSSLIIATGGLSIPQLGATDFGYRIARQFGLKTVATSPALDGFLFTDRQLQRFSELAGVSIDCIMSANGASFRENLLFTHVGLSGPASLQTSLYWREGDKVCINLMPGTDAGAWLLLHKTSGIKAELKTVLAEKLPRRFAEQYCKLYFSSRPLNQIADPDLSALGENLTNWTLVPGGTVGYKKAEVTRGGIDTDELSSKTMEARKVPGLFFIGEVVDVTGQLGGYNFQWAWASGFAAGTYA